MTPDPLDALRDAMRAIADAEHARARAWALAGSGLLDPTAGRTARLEAERGIEAAREELRRAKAALPPTPADEKAWGAH